MADIAKLVEDLSALSVLEAADLVKALEEKWGVSAAAPVAVAAAGPAEPQAQAAALARHGVSREDPCSALKGETVSDSLPATPKSPPTRRVPPRGTPRVPAQIGRASCRERV